MPCRLSSLYSIINKTSLGRDLERGGWALGRWNEEQDIFLGVFFYLYIYLFIFALFLCGSVCCDTMFMWKSDQHVFLTWVTLYAWCRILRWLGNRPSEEAEGGLCLTPRWSWLGRGAFGTQAALWIADPSASSLTLFVLFMQSLLFFPVVLCHLVGMSVCRPIVEFETPSQRDCTIWSKQIASERSTM